MSWPERLGTIQQPSATSAVSRLFPDETRTPRVTGFRDARCEVRGTEQLGFDQK